MATKFFIATYFRSDRSIGLMVRPRRLSDSSVSSACSDSESNTATTIPHIRSQTAVRFLCYSLILFYTLHAILFETYKSIQERVETNSTLDTYTLRSVGDVRHVQPPSSNDLTYQRSRRNILAGTFLVLIFL